MTETLGLDSVLIQADDLLASPIDDELVMLNLSTNAYYGLNSLSTQIWRILAEPRSVRTICERLMADYDVDRGTCEQDVLDIVQRMMTARLVRIVKT